MSNDVKLELCPFCGGPAQIIAGAPGCYYVRCEGCSVTSDDGSRERVITKWNTRHQPHREAVLGEAELNRLAGRVCEIMHYEDGRITRAWAKQVVRELATALTTPAPAEDDDALIRRIEYILDPAASAKERAARRAHLTNHDLRTILSRLRGER